MNYNTKQVEEILKKYNDVHKDEEPVYEGCKAKMCFCTGKCKKIVGWKPKRQDIWKPTL